MKWRWAKDSFVCEDSPLFNICLDKWTHFFCGFILELAALLILGWRYWIPITLILGSGFFLWECKDAVLPWEEHGWIGGDGFSWRDLVVSIIGMAIGFIIGIPNWIGIAW